MNPSFSCSDVIQIKGNARARISVKQSPAASSQCVVAIEGNKEKREEAVANALFGSHSKAPNSTISLSLSEMDGVRLQAQDVSQDPYKELAGAS